MVVTLSPGERPLPSTTFKALGSMPLAFQKSCSTSTPLSVDGCLPDFQAIVLSNCSAYRLMLFWLSQYTILLKVGERIVVKLPVIAGNGWFLLFKVKTDSGSLLTI